MTRLLAESVPHRLYSPSKVTSCGNRIVAAEIAGDPLYEQTESAAQEPPSLEVPLAMLIAPKAVVGASAVEPDWPMKISPLAPLERLEKRVIRLSAWSATHR